MDMNQPPAIVSPFAESLSIAGVKGPTALIISGSKGPLVTISMEDGSVKLGDSYEKTEAAQMFWQSVSGEYRAFLAWKAKHPTGQ